ncbi:MAG: hypothetical protein V8R55_02200 [Dysosmobacter sp.]
MDKGALLDRLGATGEDRMLLAKVWDRMQQARSRNIPAATDFLSPQQQVLTRELLRLAGAAETEYVFWEDTRRRNAAWRCSCRIGWRRKRQRAKVPSGVCGHLSGRTVP